MCGHVQNCQEACACSGLLAHRRILLDWKLSKLPSGSLWLSDDIMFLKLEKIKYSLRGSIKHFYSVWPPVFSYFEKGVTNNEIKRPAHIRTDNEMG